MALTKVTYGLLSADTSAIDLNIDANTLYVDSSANRVGIGTSSPGVHLDIESSTNNAQIEITATDGTDQSYGIFGATGNNSNGAGFYIQDKTASGSPIRFKIDSSGNVGIGTTSPGYKLDVGGSVRFAGSTSIVGTLQSYSGAFNVKNIAQDQDLNLQVNDGGTNTTALTVQGTTANVGIKTTAPNAQLHIGDSAAEGNATNPALQIGGAGTYRLGLFTTAEGAVIDNANGDDGLQFHTKTAGEAIRITADGNLEFKGQTSSFVSPGFTWHTNNYLYLRGGSAGTIIADDSGINTVQIIDGSSGYINFETGDGTSRMRIKHTGVVGIGTITPAIASGSAGLVIHSTTGGTGNTGATRLRFTNTTTGQASTDGVELSLDGNTNNFYIENRESTGNTIFYHGSETMRIDSSGKVGIGTTGPFSKLSINSNGAPATSGNMASTGLTVHNGTGGTAVQLGTYDAGSWGYIQSGYVNNSGVAREFRIMNGANYTMTLSNTGKVGIGTTAPTGQRLCIGGYSTNNSMTEANAWLVAEAVGGDGIAIGSIASSPYTTWIQSGYLNTMGTSNHYPIALNPHGGNIGIGTSTPQNTLHIATASTDSRMQFTNASSGSAYADGLWVGHDNTQAYFMHRENLPITFWTNTTERMRLDSSGNLVIGATSQISLGKFSISFNGTSQNGTVLQTTRAATGSTFIRFNNSSGTAIGSIYQNAASTVLYSTSSDYRLKQNEIAVWDGTTILKQLKPYKFNWKEDPTGEAVQGFFAHELAEIIPDAVVGEKDAVDSEGHAEYQGVDQSRLVPLLVKTIQELEARITELESK